MCSWSVRDQSSAVANWLVGVLHYDAATGCWDSGIWETLHREGMPLCGCAACIVCHLWALRVYPEAAYPGALPDRSWHRLVTFGVVCRDCCVAPAARCAPSRREGTHYQPIGQSALSPPPAVSSWAGACFLLLGLGCYRLYGDEFLQHAVLYHASRLDHRHNFSALFYSIYLEWPAPPMAAKVPPVIFLCPPVRLTLCYTLAGGFRRHLYVLLWHLLCICGIWASKIIIFFVYLTYVSVSFSLQQLCYCY